MVFAPARGNGSKRGGWKPGFEKPSGANESTTTTPPSPFGDLLDEICLADLEKSASGFRDSAVIRDPVTMASFNWIRTTKTGKPTIVVPGTLPMFPIKARS